MIYNRGTASVTNGSQSVTGTNTKWLKKVKPGHLFTIGDGTYYQVANIASDTQLYLVTPYGGSTQSDISYSVFSDFTEYFSIPYPVQEDVWKLSILRRAVHSIDRYMEDLNDRILDLEYPGMHPADMLVTPSIDAFSILQNQGLNPVDATVTPEISTVYINQQQPGGLLVADATVIPTIDEPTISIGGQLTMTVEDIEVTTLIDPVILNVLIVTADSTDTADAAAITADGRDSSPVEGQFFVLSQTVTPIIDTVVIQQSGGLTLTPQDATVQPIITTVDLSGGMVTADSDSVTADASNVTADGLLAA
jgi:hypothetical protein